MRNLNEYQHSARKTAIYPHEYGIIYTALGLNGETGEIAEKVKKVIRDRDGVFDKEAKNEMAKELGDVLFTIVNLSRHLDINPEQALNESTNKFIKRFKRIEKDLKEKKIDIKKLSLEELDVLWEKNK